MSSKIEHVAQTVNSSEQLLFFFAVSQRSLSLYAQYPSETRLRRIEESPRYHKSDAEIELLVQRLKALWADYKRLTARREHLRSQIEANSRQLVADGDIPDLSHLTGISLFNLARLAGQTGPLEDQCPDRCRERRCILRCFGDPHHLLAKTAHTPRASCPFRAAPTRRESADYVSKSTV